VTYCEWVRKCTFLTVQAQWRTAAPTPSARNSYLRQVKDDKDLEALISLIIFASQSIDTIRDRVRSQGKIAGALPVFSSGPATPRSGTMTSGWVLPFRQTSAGPVKPRGTSLRAPSNSGHRALSDQDVAAEVDAVELSIAANRKGAR
jgi:hypothetical protein